MLQSSKDGHDNTVRLALLVCGTPIPSILEVHGDYPVIFRGLFQAGLDQLKEQGAIDPSTKLVLEGFDVREGIYPRANEWDAIVISGSGKANKSLWLCLVCESLCFLLVAKQQTELQRSYAI